MSQELRQILLVLEEFIGLYFEAMKQWEGILNERVKSRRLRWIALCPRGFEYRKAGMLLTALVPISEVQGDLYSHQNRGGRN